ncbi:hypothetical protein [Streptomyces sp. MP131-18]|uniref:hypothetical protein n=1 Tax=Streptomyces sp. MP131-18 TaxID=1857892 RepID=UPI00097C1632|nr:hypothetical protein [Streptomyces sp. MP131-18]ONK09491.1 hypothetical protein STBA_01910 [Streptomyces sp. MP131-18]
MPWFKIDDGFHCHPKVFAAGTPAIGLYVRCGSWAAQQATDGVVPKQIARLYGTPRMIKALVDAGLWHQKDHDCESCPELDANSYCIHQYLERNPSRVDVDLARKAKSERQQRWRDNKKKTQITPPEQSEVDGDVDASTRRHGDAAPNPARPVPSPSPPTEEKKASPDGAPDARIGDRPRIPANSRPLVDAIGAAGIRGVGWDLGTTDWFVVEALIKRCGIDALVASAVASAQGARTAPRSARYFLPAWRALPDAPAAGRSPLPAAVGAAPPPPSHNASVIARFRARAQEQTS